MNTRLVTFIVATCAVCQTCFGGIITGTITNLQDSSGIGFGDGINDLSLYWSVGASRGPNYSGYFYGSGVTGATDVGFAAGITSIDQITDASIFTFTADSTDALSLESDLFIVLHNTLNGHYGAVELTGGSGSGALINGKLDDFLDATWWFQTDGSSNLSPQAGGAVPEPGTLCMGLLAVGFLALSKRKVWFCRD